MLKTDKQQLIEARNEGRDWREVFRGALDRYRGRRYLVFLVASDLGISHQTVYDWCKALGINLNDYRN